MINNIVKSFFSGNLRSVKIKKQIIYSLLLKGVSIIIGLLLVPLILNYLDSERYGIWLTLSSIIGWFSFFDIGMGNGLRNRFTEAIAENKYVLAKTYVSTSYAILGTVFITILIIFYIVNPFLNWQYILNTTVVDTEELSLVAQIVFTFFVLQFIFKLIGTLLLADQRPAISNSFNTLANIIIIITIYIFTRTTKGSLINLATILSFTPLFVLIIATAYFFSNDYKSYKPSFYFINLSKAKELLNLGFKFFYVQIASILLFSITNLLIAQFSSQNSVTEYNVAFKYFFIISMVQSIILTPIWSSVTDAFAKNDYDWLKNTLRKLNSLSVILSFLLLLLLLLSPYIYKIWVGDKITISFGLSFLIALYLIIQTFIAPFSSYINGLGKLKFGLFIITMKLILFLPMAYFLGKSLGTYGILMAMVIVQIPSLITEPLQVYKIINKNAYGIWNK